MIQLRSILTAADNAGAQKFIVIGINRKPKATVGEVVKAVVHGADPNGMVKDREKVQVVIVRTHKEVRRSDGSFIRFDDNAAVVIDKDNNPLGTRVFGPIAREVKERGFHKIASLAMELI